MPQKGRGNKADSGILKELYEQLGNKSTLDAVKTWLQNEYDKANSSDDTARAERIKVTQKALGMRRSREA
jgi:hypothetical protein